MKGVKKCIGFLTLFVPLALSFLISSDTNALKHEYIGIPYSSFTIPCPSYDSSTHEFSFDWDFQNECFTSDGSSLLLRFAGDSWDSSYSDLHQNFSSSYLNLTSDNSSNLYGDLLPIYRFSSDNSEVFTTFEYQNFLLHRNYVSSSIPLGYSQDNHQIRNFDHDSVPLGLLSCGPSNGAICNGLWNTREYVSSQILPYSYSSDGFYLKSKAIDTHGITYSNTFSFDDMFNSFIPKFSYLSLPLHTLDGYFINKDNLWSGREFNFQGSFEFDGSFAWHDNINDNGSSFKLMFSGIPLNSQSDDFDFIEKSYDCTFNLISLTPPGASSQYTRLDYSCPFSLDRDYLALSGIRLVMDGNGNYIWTTNNKWRFASTFVVTDNDDTPGYNFNSDLSGGGTIPGDAQNDIPDESYTEGFFDNLLNEFLPNVLNLWSFNVFNPFLSIFKLFTSGEDCVNIPILAGMLHSETTQVCPWFPASVRNILTPVVSIAAMMLLFGFIVRWFRSSSSDFSPDTEGGKK